jgi:hypothetical protein
MQELTNDEDDRIVIVMQFALKFTFDSSPSY